MPMSTLAGRSCSAMLLRGVRSVSSSLGDTDRVVQAVQVVPMGSQGLMEPKAPRAGMAHTRIASSLLRVSVKDRSIRTVLIYGAEQEEEVGSPMSHNRSFN
jgi:hypothetical protein